MIRDFVALLGITALSLSAASNTESKLRYADAIVTDSKGRPVPGLAPSDFSISMAGVRGQVASAEYVSGAAPGAGDTRRVFVILYDECSPPPTSSVDILRGFEARAVARGDRVVVLPSLEGSGAVHTLTGDRRSPDAPHFVAFARVGTACGQSGDRGIALGETKGKGAARRDLQGQPLVAGDPSYNSMISILEGLAEVPGRKNLVAISFFWGMWNDLGAGSPQIRRLIDLANSAGTAIHILDLYDTWEAVHYPPNPFGKRFGGHLAPVKRLAESSGGLLFAVDSREFSQPPDHSAERIRFVEKGLARIVEDSAAYYRLGYLAGGPDPPGGEAKLEVKVTSRGGLKVRSWSNPVPPPPAAAPSLEDRIRAALRSPFRGFEIGVRAFPVISAGEPEGRPGRRLSNLRTAISVDARDLVFQDQPGGGKRAAVDVVAAAYGRENRQAAITTDNCSLSVAEGSQPPLSERVLLCELNLGMLEPGPYMVRVAVADRAGGKVGSAYAFAPVTDFNIDFVGLSSLILDVPSRLPRSGLRLREAAQVPPPPSAPPPPRANFVDRVFAPGATVEYRFEAYGIPPGRKTRERKLEIMLDLGGGKGAPVRGRSGVLLARPAWSEKIMGNFFPNETEPGRPVLVRGEFKIPAGLLPGPYHAHICTRDTASGRWSLCIGCAFTVAAPEPSRSKD